MESEEAMSLALLVIIVLGAFGNLASLFMFSRPHMRKSSVNLLLCALSAVDLALLLLAVPVFVLPGLNLWQDDEDVRNEYLAYIFKIVYPMNLIMQTCSIYIMVLITVERWTAVCRPLQVRIWCTARKSRIALLVVFVASVIYNAIRFFEYSIVTTSEGKVTYARNLRDPNLYPHYMLVYFTGSYLVTHFLVPFGIMIILNGNVCWSIIVLRRARLQLTRQVRLQQQREHSTTIMLLVVTLIFAVCNTLTFLLNLVECVLPDLFTNPETLLLAFHLNDAANLLVILNSATTFIIYFIFSAKYRHTFLQILRSGCKLKKPRDQYYDISCTHSIRNNNSSTKKTPVGSPTDRSNSLLTPLFSNNRRSNRPSSEKGSRQNGTALQPSRRISLNLSPAQIVHKSCVPLITFTDSERIPQHCL